MRLSNLIYLLSVLFLFSCSNDEDSINLTGTYEVISIKLFDCFPEVLNVDLSMLNSTECVETSDYIYCATGNLIVRQDMSLTSTIRVSQTDRIIGLSLPFATINGVGIIDFVGDSANLCIDDRCIELIVSGSDLIWNYRSLACNNQLILRKMSQ